MCVCTCMCTRRVHMYVHALCARTLCVLARTCVRACLRMHAYATQHSCMPRTCGKETHGTKQEREHKKSPHAGERGKGAQLQCAHCPKRAPRASHAEHTHARRRQQRGKRLVVARRRLSKKYATSPKAHVSVPQAHIALSRSHSLSVTPQLQPHVSTSVLVYACACVYAR